MSKSCNIALHFVCTTYYKMHFFGEKLQGVYFWTDHWRKLTVGNSCMWPI